MTTYALMQEISADPSRVFGVLQECADYGLMNRLAAPVAGDDILCSRCDSILRQVKQNPLGRGLAWAIAAGFFYIVVVSTPMLGLGLYGGFRAGKLGTGLTVLDNQGYWILSSIVFLTTILAPLLEIAGTLVVLCALRWGKRPPWLAGLYAFLRHINAWVMVEVYLLGLLVAYSRLQGIGTVRLAPAVFGLAGLMFCIVAMRAVIDPEAVWEKIEKDALLIMRRAMCRLLVATRAVRWFARTRMRRARVVTNPSIIASQTALRGHGL